MNPELEVLINALDAYLEARGPEAEHLQLRYEALVQEALLRHPGVAKESLQKAIESCYRRWRQKQNKPSALPPKG